MNHGLRTAPGSRLRIIVLGYIVRCPLGGMAWHYLQYVLGLARLGHDVYFIEDSDDYPSCYDPTRHVTGVDAGYGLRFAAAAFERVGLGERWAYHDAHTSTWHGPCSAQVAQISRSADLLLNISGSNPLRPWLQEVAVRVFVDTDPAFEQIRQLTVPQRRDLAQQHTAFFSFGENIGQECCTVPDDGLPWQATRQPIVLEQWPTSPGPPGGRFTTVMQWDSYPTREYRGIRYGMKSESFEPYLELPRRVDSVLELALGSCSAPRDLLRQSGWQLRNSLEPTRDLRTYQDYIRESRAEFGIAKHGYVASRSGWFSERSACYLASGRPVAVQDTGFSRFLPTGTGLCCFESPQEAVAAIADVNRDYQRHCRAAREIAEQFFDSDRVLRHLLERALSSAATCPR